MSMNDFIKDLTIYTHDPRRMTVGTDVEILGVNYQVVSVAWVSGPKHWQFTLTEIR